MKKKYRYALRNQNKIKNSFSEEYLQAHLLASLNEAFSEEIDLSECIEMSRWANPKYNVIAINDVADVDCMQLFAVLEIKFDIVRLAYVSRIKG